MQICGPNFGNNIRPPVWKFEDWSILDIIVIITYSIFDQIHLFMGDLLLRLMDKLCKYYNSPWQNRQICDPNFGNITRPPSNKHYPFQSWYFNWYWHRLNLCAALLTHWSHGCWIHWWIEFTCTGRMYISSACFHTVHMDGILLHELTINVVTDPTLILSYSCIIYMKAALLHGMIK